MLSATLSVLVMSAMALGTQVRRDGEGFWIPFRNIFGYCIDVKDSNFQGNNPLQWWPCATGNPNQKWTHRPVERAGPITITSYKGETFCLDATVYAEVGRSPTINSCSPDHPGPRFAWTTADGYIKSSMGDYCILLRDLGDPSNYAGAPVVFRSCPSS